jgi:hypothetical protein
LLNLKLRNQHFVISFFRVLIHHFSTTRTKTIFLSWTRTCINFKNKSILLILYFNVILFHQQNLFHWANFRGLLGSNFTSRERFTCLRPYKVLALVNYLKPYLLMWLKILFFLFQPAFGGSNCEEPLTEEFSCNGTTPVQTANDTQICFSNFFKLFIDL